MSSEWDQRLLCPDGGCVGVIGGDGTCKVCGRAAPNWGEERKRGLRPTGEVETAEKELETAAKAEAPAAEGGPASADEFDERELCSDGACIGVIGDAGVCSVCGKPPAADDAADDADDAEEADDADDAEEK